MLRTRYIKKAEANLSGARIAKEEQNAVVCIIAQYMKVSIQMMIGSALTEKDGEVGMNRNDQNKNPVFWEQNPIIYNDEDNAPMRDDGRYPYQLRTWEEVQEEQNGGIKDRIPGT